MDHHEFITGIESWGSGGSMLDLVTLKDGSVLMIVDGAIVLYPKRDDFERGCGARVLRSTGSLPAEADHDKRLHVSARQPPFHFLSNPVEWQLSP